MKVIRRASSVVIVAVSLAACSQSTNHKLQVNAPVLSRVAVSNQHSEWDEVVVRPSILESLTDFLNSGNLRDIATWKAVFGVPETREAVALPQFADVPRGIGYEMQFEAGDESYTVCSRASGVLSFSPWRSLISVTEDDIRSRTAEHLRNEGDFPYSDEMPVMSAICTRGAFLDEFNIAICGLAVKDIVSQQTLSKTELFMKRDGSVALLDRKGNTILCKVTLPTHDSAMELAAKLRMKGGNLVVHEVQGVGFSLYGMILGEGCYYSRPGAWDRNEEWEWIGFVESDGHVRATVDPGR